MTPEQEANLDRLLVALRVSDPKVAVLKLMEALGMSVMCIHWLRGMFSLLELNSNINMSDGSWEAYRNLRDSIEAYEAFMWRIAPPRALTHQIGVFRENGYLDEEFLRLLCVDDHGRSSDRSNSNEIADVIGNVGGHDSRMKPEEEWERYGGR